MDLYLLRHGHDLHDSTSISDPRRLSNSGKRQARRAAQWLGSRRLSDIRTSGLRRAQQTGAIVARALSLSYTVDDRLNEAGCEAPEQEDLPPRLARNLGMGTSWAAAVDRIREALEELIAQDERGAHLWVGHSGTADAVFELVTRSAGEVELSTGHGGITHWEHRPGARDGPWLLHVHNLQPEFNVS